MEFSLFLCQVDEHQYPESGLKPRLEHSFGRPPPNPPPPHDGAQITRVNHVGGFVTSEGREVIVAIGAQGLRFWDARPGSPLEPPPGAYLERAWNRDLYEQEGRYLLIMTWPEHQECLVLDLETGRECFRRERPDHPELLHYGEEGEALTWCDRAVIQLPRLPRARSFS
jgi:hypothetical protein